MLEIRNLSVRYGQHVAVSHADINVLRGEIVVVLGANGAGKSSMLKAIGGMVPLDSRAGRTIDGVDVSDIPPHSLVKHGLALVPEGRGNFVELSVRENLLLGAYSQSRDDEEARLTEIFDLFPRLRERLHQQVRTMSGGEQQMVALGRAMMSRPAILLLDEPSLGLAPVVCKELFRLLVRIKKKNVGILLVEQNARQSLAIANRGYLLENGKITASGTSAELFEDGAIGRAYLGT
ncbi:ABC transporter ATP-binding protein [Oceaniradius stylonematis]|uniref:ABC transporter ATP-binding protein n=1 Tax=Oceaniradius stylonematis TaxID=2184161 RepID=UPI00273E43AF|nr:ABC transporter ATP-binding protein [Oceaniradius stylonematis]